MSKHVKVVSIKQAIDSFLLSCKVEDLATHLLIKLQFTEGGLNYGVF